MSNACTLTITYLRHEHCSWRDLHVMSELKVLEERNGLRHAYVSVDLEAHVRHRISWINVSNYILRDDVQAR